MIGTTSGVQRGCGYREQGGAYIECGLDPNGEPIEHFLVDPPEPFEPDAKIGQELIERNGVVHVFDWIGSTHYPFTADFVEEVRRFGLSRRISQNLDVERLTLDSRIICIHERARFEGHAEQDLDEEQMNDPMERCALWKQEGEESHLNYPTGACTRKWWWDAEPTRDDDAEFVGYRAVGDFSYGPVEGAEMPEPKPAVFASFPITNLAVIEADDGSHEETAQTMKDKAGARFPVIMSPA